MDIVEFLTARLDEDEAVAKDSQDGPWWIEQRDHARLIGSRADPHMVVLWQEIGIHRSTPDHIARHNPARVLAEVAAKRAILAGHSGMHECPSPHDWALGKNTDYVTEEECWTLRNLAAVHADHPDFDPAWRPE